MAKKKTVKRKTTKKKTLSKAQKSALARGRAAITKKRKTKKKPAKVSKKKKTASSRMISNEREAMVIINQQGSGMAKKRKARKTSRKRGRYMGGFGKKSGGGKVNIKGMLVGTAVGTAAAVGGSIAIAKIPIANPKIKAILPIIGGVAISMIAKGKNAGMMNQAATGLMIAGGLAVVRQFIPQLGLAGESEMYQEMGYLPESEEDPALLGVNTDLMGVNTDLMGMGEDDEEFDQ